MLSKPPDHPPVCNRLRAILTHVPFYSIEGPARLAYDAGVSRSTISRLLSGRLNPSFRLVQAVVDALSRRIGTPLDPREVFTGTGEYPTLSVCALMGCRGCLPLEAWDNRTDRLKPGWQHANPGQWSTSPGTSAPEPGSDVSSVPAIHDSLISSDAQAHAQPGTDATGTRD